jgi:hypothetical protein
VWTAKFLLLAKEEYPNECEGEVVNLNSAFFIDLLPLNNKGNLEAEAVADTEDVDQGLGIYGAVNLKEDVVTLFA